MSKEFRAFILSFTVIVLTLVSVSGCTFKKGTSGNNTVYPTGESAEAMQYVELGSSQTEYNIYDVIAETVAEVGRSSVAIYVMNADGTKAIGAGSGIIIEDFTFSSGSNYQAEWKERDDIVYILTCHHVISEDNTYGTVPVGEIEVRIPDEYDSYENGDYVFKGYIGNEKPSVYNNNGYAVTLVGGDYESDVAILKLDLNIAAYSGNKLDKSKIVKAQIPAAGSGYTVRKGETVIAIGNPTGACPGSVSTGQISSLNRKTNVSGIGTMTLMQISVPINPGSSGGGLYNLYGELIGITNSGSTEYDEINSAIPYYDLENGNGFVQIAKQLVGTATDDNYGFVSGRKAKFGFEVTKQTSSGQEYVVVSSVTSGGVAAKAGLQVKDVITKVTVNGVINSINSYADFTELWDGLTPADLVIISGNRTTGNWFNQTTVAFTTTVMSCGFWFCNTGIAISVGA